MMQTFNESSPVSNDMSPDSSPDNSPVTPTTIQHHRMSNLSFKERVKRWGVLLAVFIVVTSLISLTILNELGIINLD